jgi:RND family efflux transporter MFP subunit
MKKKNDLRLLPWNKKSKYKKYFTAKNGKIALGVLVLLIIANIAPKKAAEEVKEEVVTTKTVQVIPFSEWSPDSSREVLATVASSGEVDLLAEVTGTIAKAYVKIGDEVSEGQLLANFQILNDATQVSYDNALRSLQSTQLATQNSINSAQISLQTAQQSLSQTKLDEAQNYKEVFEQLKTKARNSESTASNALDWADRIMRASIQFRYETDNLTEFQIGSSDAIKKQETKNRIEQLQYQKAKLSTLPRFQPKDIDYIRYGEDRLTLLHDIQNVIRNMTDLIRRTPLSTNFTSTNRSTYQTTSETHSTSIDAAILTLETQIEAARSENQSNRLSILTKENAVRNAQAALELAEAQAASSISTAQSSVTLARASQSDLQVRAPFSGKIVNKTVTSYDRVTAGQTLFTLVSGNVAPKLKASITRDELKRMESAPEKITARFPNGNTVSLPDFLVSGTMDTTTQKIKVEFPLEAFDEDILVGSYVKLLLPIKNGIPNLLPISAVSFEPGGAEVIVIDAENIARRRNVETGKIISDSIEIAGGLETGERVVRFRNRVTAGEEVMINE